MMMKTPLFSGVATALVTPFLNGAVNYPLLERLVRRQVEAGVSALVLSGTTGEAPTLTDEEKIQILRRAASAAKGRCKLIAGTGSNSTAHAVAMSREAEQAGADGLLVVSPYYNKANPPGLIAHYQAVAQAVTVPVILYNVPSRTGLSIPVSVCQALSGIGNIVGIKEADTDLDRVVELRRCCDLTVWAGNDSLTVPVISVGGRGVISVAANLLPEEMIAMTEAALDGDFDTAAAIQLRLQPLLRLLFRQVNPIPVKAAMKCIGFDCGSCRLPLGPLEPECRRELEALLG